MESKAHPEACDFAGINTSLLVRYVAANGPTGAVERLLRTAGETRTAEQLMDPGTWSSYDQFRRLTEAAAKCFGGVAMLERAAASGLAETTMPDLTAMLQSLGSPDALLELITNAGSASLAPVVDIEGERESDDEWTVRLSFHNGREPFREYCAWSAGLFTSIPEMFGCRAEVSEEACQCDGAPRCVFRITWHEPEIGTEIAQLQQRNKVLEARLESLQETVADLVSGSDLEDVLSRILAAASRSINAPMFVLALDELPDAARRVYTYGFNDENRERVTTELLADDGDNVHRLIVDVASRSRRYGRLAALNPRADFFPQERAVLESHARLAATALDSATALAEARRQAETASALLTLSTALAGIASTDDMATNLARAVPDVVGCDRACVVLYQPGAECGRVVATRGYDTEDDVWLRSMDIPGRSDRSPDITVEVWDRATAAEHPFLSSLMDRVGSVAVATVPIITDGMHAGLVVADVVERAPRLTGDRHLPERLRGLASQASIAIRNARLLDEIRHQALHDSLTGLPNRVLILDRVEQMLARARRHSEECAALYVDLDGFKVINDTLGHEAGDQLLQSVASRLSAALREVDTVARLGGDEFVVLVDGSSPFGSPELVADRLLEVLREPFAIEKASRGEVAITASIGIALGSSRATANDLLRDADIALYEAKAAGRNCHVTFERSMQTAVEDRLTLELDLRAALKDNQFFLMYQPIFDLETAKTLGLEALIRWNHPQRGLIQPDAFIPVLEDTKLIVEVGRWVTNEACRQAVAWNLYERGMYMSVNVSARQLDDDNFHHELQRALEVTGLKAETLVLEVTETAIMRDADATTHRLEALKELGVGVAIDDFGTGYSSLGYLRQFPIDILKIDRSFVAAMRDSTEAAALIHTLVQLGKQLGLRTLAEGIELHEQFCLLQDEQCDSGQGYMFARPLPENAVEAFLANDHPMTRDAVS